MVEAPFTTVIERDERGRPWVKGTNTKVAEIVIDKNAWGMSAEQIHEEHPHLSLPHIYAAFQYYYEHKEEIDRQIEEAEREAEAICARQPESEVVKRLRALKYGK